MRYLTVQETLEIYRRVMQTTGGFAGLRDLNALESAVSQPRATFDGKDLYPTLAEKAAAIGFSLVQNHPFIDGNKRTGHAAMEIFLLLNGSEIDASIVEQENIILQVASSKLKREEFAAWLTTHLIERSKT
jgi:death on curing protein